MRLASFDAHGWLEFYVFLCGWFLPKSGGFESESITFQDGKLRDLQNKKSILPLGFMRALSSPSFSVVIPLFNKEKSVGRCVDSVLKQSYQSFEIIIVNDGSTDNSRQAVQQIKDSRILLFERSNGGVSTARNFGIAQARHEFIALLDADDEWEPLFLEKMVFLIQKFPEAGLYYAAHANVNSKGHAVSSTMIPTLPANHACRIDIFNYTTDYGPWSSATVIRKSLLEKTGLFDPKLVKGEDIDMWIRFALNGPVALFNASLAIYHGDAENRAMQKPCPPQSCLISNLAKYAAVARKNPQFHLYLQRMRVGHICNFLGGSLCELADAHHEIDNLDLSVLPPVWTLIRYSPRFLRRLVFRVYVHGGRIANRLSKMLRRSDQTQSSSLVRQT